MPQVSIIIPAYNAERWLPETLESVAAQEIADLEVIIVNDGSTDGTAAYVEKQWPQHRLISTANKGVSHARNLGTSLATGEFVQYLDADDLLAPGKLARQISILIAEPEIDVVYSNWQRLIQHENGVFASGEKVERTIGEVDPDPQLAFFSAFWCPTAAYLYRRHFLSKVGEWKEWLPVAQDARFAWDCARAGARWRHDPHIGVLYRQHHTGSVSTRSRLAFLKDCWANTLDIERIWIAEGTFKEGRRAAILGSCENLARAFFELDQALFEEVYAHMIALDPAFRPTGTVLPLLTSLLGYRKAETIALFYRRLKRLGRPGMKALT
ncbi:MAG: putative glycosyl transferase [Verrucomicrobiaceae bacterium]|nr:putative glycosyl transferase [Verrucomicrobiaceae bacterium]